MEIEEYLQISHFIDARLEDGESVDEAYQSMRVKYGYDKYWEFINQLQRSLYEV